jgi:D-aminoacyl-tRNA deacylase
MIALIQRVISARVEVNKAVIGEINQGILAFIAVEKNDSEKNAVQLLSKISGYRIFADENNRMNLNLSAISGELLLVPQFTLAANTSKGTKPSFSSAAPPALGQKLFKHITMLAAQLDIKIATGQFGADMQVHLINDGPVTFWLQG